MKYGLQERVSLRENPLSVGKITARRIPARYEYQAYYTLRMDNGVYLYDRSESSLEVIPQIEDVTFVAGNGWAMPISHSSPRLVKQ